MRKLDDDISTRWQTISTSQMHCSTFVHDARPLTTHVVMPQCGCSHGRWYVCQADDEIVCSVACITYQTHFSFLNRPKGWANTTCGRETAEIFEQCRLKMWIFESTHKTNTLLDSRYQHFANNILSIACIRPHCSSGNRYSPWQMRK